MPLVEIAVEDRLAILTLNAPPANGYTHAMMRELDEAILRVRGDDAVQAAVLTGAGEKFFCAGADLKELQKASPSAKYAFCLHANETLQRMEATPKPFIAAINGHCVGGGLEIALACDLRLARKGTGKLGMPEVALGVLPGTGGTQRLVRLLGRSEALELMATGRLFDAEEALARRLLNHVVETPTASAFLEQAKTYARQFCAPGRAAQAVGLLKRAVISGAESSLAEGLALERELQQRLFLSADAVEGLAAFVEKRPPRFEGR
jgi:enoyl-CoA hydratase/carnithine racemase